MKTTYYLFATFFLVVLLASCSTDEQVTDLTSDKYVESKDIIIKERNPELPSVVKAPIIYEDQLSTKSVGQNGEIIGNSDALLGYSYSVGNSILGDYQNVISPVLNLQKIKELGLECLISKRLSSNESSVITYSSFDQYVNKSNVTKKFGSGFNLNIGLFSIGRKKKTSKVFTTSVTDSTNHVFGELDINVRHNSYRLQTDAAISKIIARQCLSKLFQRSLYSSTIGDILDKYGHFVLTGYVTGGRALGLYEATTSSGYSVSTNERTLSDVINASFKWKSDYDGSGDLSFDNSNTSTIASVGKLEKMRVFIQTYGGEQMLQIPPATVSMDALNLNLTPWLNSLQSEDTHTIIDVLDGGLNPLSNFVLEENFKKRFDFTSKGTLDYQPYFTLPYINVCKIFSRVSSNGTPLYKVGAVLKTRQGDYIVIGYGDSKDASDSELLANENFTTFASKARAIGLEKYSYYNVKVSMNSSRKLNSYVMSPLVIDLNTINESSMYRYHNPKSDMVYIYDRIHRVALSYYFDPLDEDWVLDEYGMRDWVESLPEKRISMASLANSYRIIGL